MASQTKQNQSSTPHTGVTEPVERAARVGELMDLYGPLLTERQMQFMKLHYEDDLSFGEIAREFGVSRQAVHDAVKHAEQALEDYDARLGFSPSMAKRRTGTAEPSPAEETPAPASVQPAAASVDGLGDPIRRLETILDRLRRSGGVLYNADGMAREVSEILDALRRLDGRA